MPSKVVHRPIKSEGPQRRFIPLRTNVNREINIILFLIVLSFVVGRVVVVRVWAFLFVDAGRCLAHTHTHTPILIFHGDFHIDFLSEMRLVLFFCFFLLPLDASHVMEKGRMAILILFALTPPPHARWSFKPSEKTKPPKDLRGQTKSKKSRLLWLFDLSIMTNATQPFGVSNVLSIIVSLHMREHHIL